MLSIERDIRLAFPSLIVACVVLASAAYGGSGYWEKAAGDAQASVDLNPEYAKGDLFT